MKIKISNTERCSNCGYWYIPDSDDPLKGACPECGEPLNCV